MNAKSAVILAAIVLGYFIPAALGGTGPIYAALVLIIVFAISAYGMDLIVSDLGEVSLAHPIFFAVGAYTTALLSKGYSPVLTLVASVVLSAALAAAIGAVTLRLKAFAFSLVTYAFLVVAATTVHNWALVGASDGIRGIPLLSLSLFGWSFEATGDRELWMVAYPLLLLTLLFTMKFRQSRLGYAAVASHLNAKLATVSGFDIQLVRLQVFVVAAGLTGVAGWLYAYQRAFVGPDVLDNYFLILPLTAVVIIGRRMLLGGLLGTVVLVGQERFLSLGANLDKVLLGIALVAALTTLPNGLGGTLRTLLARRQPSLDGEDFIEATAKPVPQLSGDSVR